MFTRRADDIWSPESHIKKFDPSFRTQDYHLRYLYLVLQLQCYLELLGSTCFGALSDNWALNYASLACFANLLNPRPLHILIHERKINTPCGVLIGGEHSKTQYQIHCPRSEQKTNRT